MSRAVPANLEPFVAALGREDAMRFMLTFGGSEVYLPERPGNHSAPARLVGASGVAALAKALGSGIVKVPLARRWLAAEMRKDGAGTAAIARAIRADVATVRRWRAEEEAARKQLSLFD